MPEKVRDFRRLGPPCDLDPIRGAEPRVATAYEIFISNTTRPDLPRQEPYGSQIIE